MFHNLSPDLLLLRLCPLPPPPLQFLSWETSVSVGEKRVNLSTRKKFVRERLDYELSVVKCSEALDQLDRFHRLLTRCIVNNRLRGESKGRAAQAPAPRKIGPFTCYFDKATVSVAVSSCHWGVRFPRSRDLLWSESVVVAFVLLFSVQLFSTQRINICNPFSPLFLAL